ncbi:methyltransferase domain-containing protein [Candidatus Omnitrophota bacterium]
MINKIKLRDAFSRSSRMYEAKAALQKEIAGELSDRINHGIKNAKSIVDIGMGTGFLTERLTHLFSNARICGLDFASGMTSFAKERSDAIRILQADAEHLPFADESFDLVVSNLTYQWVIKLEDAFKEVNRVLKKRKKFYFTCFGAKTLHELRNSFADAEPSFDRKTHLPHQLPIEKFLYASGFKRVTVECKLQKRIFHDVFDLVGWLKDIGANYSGKTEFIGLKKWKQANNYYLSHYKSDGGIFATFEVLWVEAQK